MDNKYVLAWLRATAYRPTYNWCTVLCNDLIRAAVVRSLQNVKVREKQRIRPICLQHMRERLYECIAMV